MSEDYVMSGLPIYKAALLDDWDSVSQLLEDDPSLMTKSLTVWSETPLHIAAGTNRSNRFVEKLVERIVAAGEKDKLLLETCYELTPLLYAAKAGNTAAARLLVENNPDIIWVRTSLGDNALKSASHHGNRETLKYLLTVTPGLLPGEEGASPYTGVDGGDLITFTIMAELYDVALDIINMHPNTVLESAMDGQTALQILAQKPGVFLSGSNLRFWGHLIYSFIPMEMCGGATQDNIRKNILLRIFAPSIKNIYDIKVYNNMSRLLVDRICQIVIETGNHNKAWNIFGSAISTAIKYGTYELIETCILAYPGIIWYRRGGNDPYIFRQAIKHRQERVYNLVYQMSRHTLFQGTEAHNGDNALHIAAKLAPPHRLKVVTGAALQMQREIQWFQVVEKFVEHYVKEDLNNDGKTPRMVFTDEHKTLLEEGQQWMKGTASSLSFVAALIVTIAFAAVFNVPGGRKEDGEPVFLKYNAFMLFIVSDVVALFSSATSLLTFLGILTSRYAEEDFLYALPKRLTIGLLSLFMSLAATLIAFSSALSLVFEDKVIWIVAPLVVATSIPLCLFGVVQFPLLVELVKSTYGRSIFHQQNATKLH